MQSANSNLPTGTIYGEKTFTVQTNGQLMRAAAHGPTIIAHRGGNPVRLDEVAHVFDGVENDKTAAWSNGERCIYLSGAEAARRERRRRWSTRISGAAAVDRSAAAGVGDARRAQRSLG